jgi:predicted nucleic acid-binding protein
VTTTNLKRQVAWDAVVVLDFLSERKDRHPHIKPIIADAMDGKCVIVVSVMAIAESLYLDKKGAEEANAIIREFFDNENVAPVACGRNVAELAQVLRRSQKIGGMDSIYAATALITKTPVLLTNDGDGKGRQKGKLLPLDGILTHDGMTLRIVTPENYPALLLSGPGKLEFHPLPKP